MGYFKLRNKYMISEKYLMEKYVLNKKRKTKYDYGSVLVKVNDSYVKHLRYLQSIFRASDLTKLGIEKNHHITVLYGLKNTNPSEIKNVLLKLKQKSFTVNITGVDMFNNETDVIYLKCQSPILHTVRNHFEVIPHIKTHSNYTPHITLAYLKPGSGKFYLETLKKVFKPGIINIDYVYVSDKNSNEMRFRLSNGVNLGSNSDNKLNV